MANQTLRAPWVRLYTTLGCHLCDEALVLLKEFGLQVEMVEIADDDVLFERYGLRIPVVGNMGTHGEGDELDWPFDAPQLTQWLNHQA